MLMGVNLTKGDAVALFHCCMGVVPFNKVTTALVWIKLLRLFSHCSRNK